MFVEKRKKLELEGKTKEKLERIVVAPGFQNCFMRLPQGWYLQRVTKLNLLTSHLLVKLRFLDRNLWRTFGGSKKVGFRRSLACFKALEVSYNFPRNSLLQKTHEFFIIPKIPLEGQNCQKLTSSKLIQKPPSCIFSSQTPSKLSRNHKNFRVLIFHT